MTEKRFTLYKGLDTINIMDNTKFREQIYINKSSKDMKCLVGLLNELAEENKEIKIQYDNLKAQRDEFYRGARENANHVGQLEKENKELKAENEQLKNENAKMKKELSLLAEFNQKAIL